MDAITRGYATAVAIIDRQTIHVHDMLAEVETEFPEAKVLTSVGVSHDSLRHLCCVKGVPLGAI